MATYTEGARLSGLLKTEFDQTFNRESVTVLAGSGSDRELLLGTVIGKITKGTASAAAGGSNTGNGTMGAITVGAAAVAGAYSLKITKAAANAGDFIVTDPNGVVVGNGTVAVAFAGGGLSFTLADGSTDFAVGDTFAITVAAGSGKVVQLDLTGTNGSEDVYGVLLGDATAPDGSDGYGVALVRGPATISDAAIVYPSGATADQKTAIRAALTALGIVIRQGV